MKLLAAVLVTALVAGCGGGHLVDALARVAETGVSAVSEVVDNS